MQENQVTYKVVNDTEGRTLYQASFDGNQSKTPWLQRTMPEKVYVTIAGTEYTLELKESVNKSGKQVRIAFTNIPGYNLRAVFSIGVDPGRPSSRGTITLVPIKKENKAG